MKSPLLRHIEKTRKRLQLIYSSIRQSWFNYLSLYKTCRQLILVGKLQAESTFLRDSGGCLFLILSGLWRGILLLAIISGRMVLVQPRGSVLFRISPPKKMVYNFRDDQSKILSPLSCTTKGKEMWLKKRPRNLKWYCKKHFQKTFCR